MLKSVEDINATKKRLTIEIPSDLIENEISSSLEKLRQTVKIPGFRQGKAPLTLIEKRFGKEVEAEVLDKIIPQHLSNAIREADLKPVTMPTLDEEFEFKRRGPINLSITIEVLPKIENLNYEQIRIKEIPVSVDESETEDTLKKLQSQKAVYEVAEKDIEMDDLVMFEHVDSEVIGEEQIPSLNETISKMGNEVFPPDIMEKVLGKKKGDTVEFTTTFNESTSKELAGKTVQTKVSIKEVKKKNLPTIDDEFAKDIGFEDLAKLKEKVREKIHEAKNEHVNKIQKAEILKKIIESHTFDVPETLLQREMDSLVLQENLSDQKNKTEQKDTASFQNELDISNIITEAQGTEQEKEQSEDREAQLKDKALRHVQASIIIDAIGQKEGIMVSEEEVNTRIAYLAQRLSATPEAVKTFFTYKEGSLEGLKSSVFQDKVLEMLLAKATIEKGE